MSDDVELSLRQIMLAIDALARRVEALEQGAAGAHGNIGQHLEGALKLLARRAKRPIPEDLSEKRRQAARARWGGSIEGNRHIRLSIARGRGTHTEEEWLALLAVCGFKCLRCGSAKVVKDHIIPIHHDGSSDGIDNIQPLCRPCNTSKGHDRIDHRPEGWRDRIASMIAAKSMQNCGGTIHDESGDYDGEALQRSLQHRSNIAPKSMQKTRRKPDPPPEISTELSTGSPAEPVASPPSAAAAKVWLAYAAAYKLRYGVFPVRNAKTNACIKHFVGRVPMAEAPAVAEFYLGDAEPLYVKAAHPLELLLRDAEKLRMAWATGRRVNGHDGPVKPWWEVWSGIEAVGKELGLEQGDNPQIFRAQVLRAAAAAGRLPEAAQHKLGVFLGSP